MRSGKDFIADFFAAIEKSWIFLSEPREKSAYQNNKSFINDVLFLKVTRLSYLYFLWLYMAKNIDGIIIVIFN